MVLKAGNVYWRKIIILHEVVQYKLSENQYKLQTKSLNLLKPTGYVMHQQFNIQQLYALPTLYLSENKQRLLPPYNITNRFLQPRWKVFTAWYKLGL